MSNEKVPLVAPAVCNVEEKHKKKEGRGYLAYGVVATALCMGFVANSNGIFIPPEAHLLRSSTSACKSFCKSDRSTHSDAILCDPGSFMLGQCSGCNFCQPKGNCQGFCESDRSTHSDKILCNPGNFMNGQCSGCNFCQSSPSGPTFTDIRGTPWAPKSDPGGCSVPAFGYGMEYRDDAIAVGDLRALGPLMIKTEPEGHRNCGQLYDIQCKNSAGVTGPKISAIVVSTCDVGDYSCGVDMVHSTWKKATKNADCCAVCTVELNKSSIFKNYEDMVCTFRADCGDCQYNPYYASVGLVNTKGKIVVSVSADGQSMRNNDGYNQFWDGNGPYNGNSKFVFTFADGNTHSCKYNELRKPSNVHIWGSD